ncbi:beta-ketoacyl synthase N-terminal-like domain-containing protein [Streptomyces canus]|uniref:thiolase family protein n=1 Tax=Streptomyces canus TaxID=58343 RepID=UPI0036A35D37
MARTPRSSRDAYFGNANGAGEENRNVGRMAALLAGLSTSVPGVTVNRLCASGLEVVIQAARAIAVGDGSIAVAGGVESMTVHDGPLLNSLRTLHPCGPCAAAGERRANPV